MFNFSCILLYTNTNKYLTGRPNPTGTEVAFVNSYIDESIRPLYPFGYGLFYTEYAYSDVRLDQKEMDKNGVITAKVTVTNTGLRTGTEKVQMYLRDVKRVVRPIRMLRGVQKVTLAPSENKEVAFEINEEMLNFYDINMEYVSEPGLFQVFMGHDSDTENMSEFKLIKKNSIMERSVVDGTTVLAQSSSRILKKVTLIDTYIPVGRNYIIRIFSEKP